MKRFFIAAIALMAMVACSKDDTASVLDTTKKSVTINISNILTPSKAVTDTAGTEDVACTKVEDLVFGFCDGAGNLVTALTISDAVEEGGSYVFHALDQRVSNLYVIANGAGANKITKTNNVPQSMAAAHTLAETQTPSVEWDEIIVYGESYITHAKDASGKDVLCEYAGKSYPLFQASVTVAPLHARLEIGSISCTDLGQGEYGRTYNKIALKSLTLAGAFTETLGTTADGFIFDVNATPAVTSLTPGTGKVWSWNLLGMSTPDLVLTIDALEGEGWTIPNNARTRTVTVAAYQVDPLTYTNKSNLRADGKTIDKFVPGEIYRMDLNFKEENMHNDMPYLCVDVDVKIAKWVIVKVTPSFQ